MLSISIQNSNKNTGMKIIMMLIEIYLKTIRIL